MAVEQPPSPPASPTKKRKVKTDGYEAPVWAKCKKRLSDWRRDDYLLEFEMDSSEWDVLEAQVTPRAQHTLIVDETATRWDYRV